MNLPPLVTTSPAGTLWEDAGVLGQPDTEILFGDDRLDVGAQSGGRFRVGLWLDPSGCRGVEGSYMMLGEGRERFEQTSEGDPILARPIFNTATGEQDALIVAFEGQDGAVPPNHFEYHGSMAVSGKTRLQGAEALFRRSLFQQCESRLDFLLGYQFNRLEDELRIEQDFEVVDDPLVIAGTTVDLFDLFDARNDFHGAQLGVVFRERVCRWSMEMLLKLGLGNTHSQVVIDGSTIQDPPPPAPALDGFLAAGTNIGVYEQDQFTMIPELGVTLGYDVTCNLRATFGYTFIYWSKVARPGDQIDLHVFMSDQVLPHEHPQFTWVTTDFWAQGMRFGLDYRF